MLSAPCPHVGLIAVGALAPAPDRFRAVRGCAVCATGSAQISPFWMSADFAIVAIPASVARPTLAGFDSAGLLPVDECSCEHGKPGGEGGYGAATASAGLVAVGRLGCFFEPLS